MMKKITMAAVLFSLAAGLFAQSKPFPAHYTYATGSILPSNYTRAQMDQQVENLWNQWKAIYLMNDCPSHPEEYYVLFSDGTDINTSEGLGYGMLLSAYMAGYDANAKIYYDGLYNFYKAHPSNITGSTYLMAWEQISGCANVSGPDAATDGDMDIAYSLLLADKQWGSAGAINYKLAATNMIADILKQEVNGSILKLGDWYDNADATYGASTRPSDFMIDHLRAFQTATGNANWGNVINNIYNVITTIQTNNSPATGLLPDFVINCNTTPKPAPASFLEGKNDGNYAYNACRVPWRLGTDFLISGNTSTKAACDKISSWIVGKTGSNANNVLSGYLLTGGNITNNNFQEPEYIGPFGVGAMCNSANQAFVNSCYDYIISYPITDAANYYQNTVGLLCALVMSGNYWPPSATSGYTLSTTASNGTITVSPVKDIYAANDVVTLTAVPNNGYKFDSWSGDATGTTNPVTVTMTGNKTVTANITSLSGQWCAVQADLINEGNWYGVADPKSKMDTSFTLTAGEIKAPWTVAKMSAPNAWDTYIELDGSGTFTTDNMKALSKVKVTYKSDKPFIMSLPQPSLAPTGESYMISLPASTTWSTVEADTSLFKVPSWSTTTIQKHLDSVNTVAFAPDVDPTKAAVTGTFEIKELLLCNVPLMVTVAEIESIDEVFDIFPNPVHDQLTIFSKKAVSEQATAELFDISGRRCYSTVLTGDVVNAKIDMSQLQSGVYILKFFSGSRCSSKKIIVY